MKQRYDWLDLWRSLAVLTMLTFHAMWDLELVGAIAPGLTETPLADVVRYCGGGSFILISGILVLRSGNPVRRGFFLFCIGLAAAIVTHLAGMPIRFGILQLMGTCMMLCGAFKARLERIRSKLWTMIFLLLFAASWFATARVTVPYRMLYPLGFRTVDFYSADYWPLLPWGLLYLTGSQLGRLLRDPPTARRRPIPAALTFLGRHSLIIYLIHQPILYGLSYLLFCGKN